MNTTGFILLVSWCLTVDADIFYFSPRLPSTRATDFSSCGRSEEAACSCEDFAALFHTLCSFRLCSRVGVLIRFLPGECRIPFAGYTSWPRSGRGRLLSPFAFVPESCSCTMVRLTSSPTNRTIILPVYVAQAGKNRTRPQSGLPGKIGADWALFAFALRMVRVENLIFKANFDVAFNYLYVERAAQFLVRNCTFLNLGPTVGGIVAIPGYKRAIRKFVIDGCEFFSRTKPETPWMSFASGILVWFGVSAEISNCRFWLACDSQHSDEVSGLWMETSTHRGRR